jgi:hypothetical protein
VKGISALSFTTTTHDFSGIDDPGPNPAWLAGSRELFKISYDSAEYNSTNGTMSFDFWFDEPIMPGVGFLVFSDFDVLEQCRITARTPDGTRISHAQMTLEQFNGRDPEVATSQDVQFVRITGGSGISGLLNSTVQNERPDPVVTLSASVPIARVRYEFDLHPNQKSSMVTNHVDFQFVQRTYV